jgi:hypothetical protein
MLGVSRPAVRDQLNHEVLTWYALVMHIDYLKYG